jgi:hypothetical protein
MSRTFCASIILALVSYEKSEIYKLGFKLAVNSDQLCRGFPKWKPYSLAHQLRTSSGSVVANYVEGFGCPGLFEADHR